MLDKDNRLSPWSWLAFVVACIVVFMMLLGGCGAGYKAYSRYQQRADRSQNRQQAIYDNQNQTKINQIRISQQAQLVKVTKQQAQIRYENSVGIRRAQDEISRTLTPLYIQFEAIQAQLAMAKSQNHTVLWIPAAENAVPTVDVTGGQP